MKAVGCLGNTNVHFLSLKNALQSQGINLVQIGGKETLSNRRVGLAHGVINKTFSVLERVFGSFNSAYIESATALIDENEIECVFAYWGTRVIPYAVALKKERPNLKIILNVLCHPMGLSHSRVKSQNCYFRAMCGVFDGLIFSSRIMQDYFLEMKLLPTYMPYVIVPPVPSYSFIPQNRRPPCKDIPNIIFLGRTDWWAAQKSDVLLNAFDAIMREGIHIYYCRNKLDKAESSGYRHLFDWMEFTELSEYVTGFDASLVMYNLESCSNTDRYKVTVPDRLAASVCSGIPVAVPARGYEASKDFLGEYGAVIEFSSFQDLRSQLGDRPAISALKKRAVHNAEKYYVIERYTTQLLDIIARVTEMAL